MIQDYQPTMTTNNAISSETANKTDEQDEQFAPFAEKMINEGLPDLMIRSFHYYYQQLLAGETGFITNAEAGPVNALPDAEKMDRYHDAGIAALNKTVMLNLNGGLGTSMGMTGPKSLLPVKGDLTFLDIIVNQTIHLRRVHNARLPLVFMNSFNTQQQTETALEEYTELTQSVPFGFVQHKEPKILKESMQPATWPADRDKEWCPPGHGDLYSALLTSGMLDSLIDAGFEYMFVSNSDNLGATLDLDILGYFAQEELPFLMEVADRTQADSKGGHLAQRPDGQLILREVAQCPPEEIESFQNIGHYTYFNTNNLWVHLPTLQRITTERDGILGLALIRNEKPVDPTQPDSPRVYQLETAMGSAIGVFEGAQAVRVPRTRFVPVKKNNDLLVLLSDVYRLSDSYNMELACERQPLVNLDPKYYQLIGDMQARFPHGAPSLINCTSLRVVGDVHFGRDIVMEGNVEVINNDDEPMYIADGTILRG